MPLRPIKEGVSNPIPEDQPKAARASMAHMPVDEWLKGFKEINLGYTQEQAMAEAARCINCGVCSECLQCVVACQAGAVAHEQGPRTTEFNVGAVVLAPGFQTYDPTKYAAYHYANYPGVGTSLEFERIMRSSEQALASECLSIAYTYTEPTVFFELARDVAIRARAHGLANVFVTNGYMTPEALEAARPWLDAANVDLKSFDDRWYRRTCGARLDPVLQTIAAMRRLGVWVEVTTLVIPGQKDSDENLRSIARFIASVGTDVPWHVSAFFPSHHMLDVASTDLATLERAHRIGVQEGLAFVYSGNAPGRGHESTLCPRCREVLIERRGFEVRRVAIPSGTCPACGLVVPGRWDNLAAKTP